MVGTLYYINGCPGARAVRLYLKYLNIEVNEKLLDLSKGEHLEAEFLKLNPMHTVPTLKLENGDSLWESRLILKFFSKGHSEADNFEIDKWLFWDLGFLNTNVGKVIYPRLFLNTEPTEKDTERLVEKLNYLDNHLSNHKYLVDNTGFSIADLSSSMLIYNSQLRSDLEGVEITNYPNINRWQADIKSNFSEEIWDSVMSEFFKWCNENKV